MRKFIIKLLILIIIFIFTLIVIKYNPNNKEWIKDKLLTNNISFKKIENIYSKYFGSIIPFDLTNDSTMVFNEKIEYKSINKYKDGIVLEVNNNYLVPSLIDGIVVFIGDKDEYKNTLIVEGEDVTIWYSNINSNLSLYDGVRKYEYLGEALDNKLILVFKKDGKVVDYNEYIK